MLGIFCSAVHSSIYGALSFFVFDRKGSIHSAAILEHTFTVVRHTGFVACNTFDIENVYWF